MKLDTIIGIITMTLTICFKFCSPVIRMCRFEITDHIDRSFYCNGSYNSFKKTFKNFLIFRRFICCLVNNVANAKG